MNEFIGLNVEGIKSISVIVVLPFSPVRSAILRCPLGDLGWGTG